MKKWVGVGVAPILAVLALGIVLHAQDRTTFVRETQERGFRAGGFERGPGFRGPHHRMGSRLLAMLDNDRVKARLGLTDDQANRLHQIAVDSEKATVKTRADMKIRRIELRELLRADKPDQAAVMKKVDEISALRGQMMKEHISALLSAKSVLTPEQQKKIRSFMQHWRGERVGHNRFFERHVQPPMGMRGGPPAPPDAPEAPPKPE